MLARLQGADPAQMAKALGLSQRYVPAGRQTKQGQTCMGYRFSFTASGLHGQGTLWIARTTSLPVEEDTVSALAPHLSWCARRSDGATGMMPASPSRPSRRHDVGRGK
jgi:hypothetical protein